MTDVLRIALGDQPYPANEQCVRDIVEQAMANHILGQLPDLPPDTLMHESGKIAQQLIENARLRADRDTARNAFEVDRLQRATLGLETKIVLLKGAAYHALGLHAGVGRRSSDMDILVARHDLERVEKALRDHGYVDHITTIDPYAQAYYRNYMHELPPLIHKVRRTVIDVHHALSPMTARVRETTDELIDDAQPCQDKSVAVLTPTDRFLHAALHSLYDGELAYPLRDMLDLAFLYRDLSPGERNGLMNRAVAVGLEKPAALAVRLLVMFGLAGEWDQPLPPSPAPITERIMAAMIKQGQSEGLKAFYLYCRGHLLRMPVHQLAVHLSRKIWQRLRPQSAGPEVDQQTIEDHLR